MIPTSTNVSVQVGAAAGGDSVVVFVTEKAKAVPETKGLGEAEKTTIARLIAGGVARGKSKEVATEVVESGGKQRQILIAGLGLPDKITAETFREAGGAIAKAVRKYKIGRIAILLSSANTTAKLDEATVADAVATGFLLASFQYEDRKSTRLN